MVVEELEEVVVSVDFWLVVLGVEEVEVVDVEATVGVYGGEVDVGVHVVEGVHEGVEDVEVSGGGVQDVVGGDGEGVGVGEGVELLLAVV